MLIQNTPQISQYRNLTKSSTPTFQAKMQFNGTRVFYNSDKSELDRGIVGLLKGKPFQKLMNKFNKAHPEQTVEFSFKEPVCYGFNYISGNGVAMSNAKLVAKNLTTNKTKDINLEDYKYPFYNLVDKVLSSKNFWIH